MVVWARKKFHAQYTSNDELPNCILNIFNYSWLSNKNYPVTLLGQRGENKSYFHPQMINFLKGKLHFYNGTCRVTSITFKKWAIYLLRYLSKKIWATSSRLNVPHEIMGVWARKKFHAQYTSNNELPNYVLNIFNYSWLSNKNYRVVLLGKRSENKSSFHPQMINFLKENYILLF